MSKRGGQEAVSGLIRRRPRHSSCPGDTCRLPSALPGPADEYSATDRSARLWSRNLSIWCSNTLSQTDPYPPSSVHRTTRKGSWENCRPEKVAHQAGSEPIVAGVEDTENATVPPPPVLARREDASHTGTWSRLCADGNLAEAVEAMEDLVRKGCHISPSLYYLALKGSIEQKDVDVGQRIHALALKSGYASNTFLANHIMRMYTSQGRLQDAMQVFTTVAAPDAFMWASVILAHSEHKQPLQAIKLYQNMRQSTVKANNHIFVAVLKACANATDLVSGKEVHADLLASAVEPNIFVGNCLVDMYAKCGSLDNARRVFDGLPTKDVVSWNIMIAGFAQHGLAREALALYESMQQEDIDMANHVTFASLLKACASVRALNEGKQIHSQIEKGGFEADVVVGNCIVDMYAKCGSVVDARRVFDSLPVRDVVTWTAMLAGYVQQGLGRNALDLYADMQREAAIEANQYTYACLLKACASIGALQEGKQLHSQIRTKRLDFDAAIATSLVDMYVKCKSLEDGRTVFDRLVIKDVGTWTAMITGYVDHGLGHEALVLYAQMLQEGIPANSTTYVCLLQACTDTANLVQGKQLHFELQERGLEIDAVIGSCLVDMYAKCGSLDDARSVFNRVSTKNVVTWNAMISGYALCGRGREALTLFASMQREANTVASNFTFSCLLKACASIGAFYEGKELHSLIREQGLETDLVVGNSLVDMYTKCGSLEDARRVFDGLSSKDVVTWTAMITGYAQHGLGQEALSLYELMQKEGIIPANNSTFVSLLKACASVGDIYQGKKIHAQLCKRGLEADVAVGSSLVNLYTKSGSLDEARKVFDRLPTRDVVTWNVMITGYADNDLGHEALALYANLQHEGTTEANPATFVPLLKACGCVGAFQEGKQLHRQILERQLEADDVVIGSSLVDMYANCGSFEGALQVFFGLPIRTVATWTALLRACGQEHGAQRAMQYFQQMQEQGVHPNEETFRCLIMACSREGLVDEGRHCFRMMVESFGIQPGVDHYLCMVDLFGLTGHLDEAEIMLQTMPFDTTSSGWTSLLSACTSHGDIERGRRCFDHLTRLEPQNSTAYVLLAGMYANAGRWADVDSIETLRKSAGAYRKPARAWIEVSSKVHSFIVAEDMDIFPKLRSLALQLKDGNGHVLEAEIVKEVFDKEDVLCGHAEKLAMAYGLRNTPDGATLLVTKNVQMCKDCHTYCKGISRVDKRNIIVRDAHHLHHFMDGECTCSLQY